MYDDVFLFCVMVFGLFFWIDSDFFYIVCIV